VSEQWHASSRESKMERIEAMGKCMFGTDDNEGHGLMIKSSRPQTLTDSV